MNVSYHPSVQGDVNEILDHYRSAGGDALADRFFQESMRRIQTLAAHPERHPIYLGRSPYTTSIRKQVVSLVASSTPLRTSPKGAT